MSTTERHENPGGLGTDGAEEKFRSYFEESPFAIIVVDGSGRFLEVNAAAAELFGVDAERLLTMRVMEFVDPAHVVEVEAAMRTLAGTGAFRKTVPLRHVSGRVIWGELKARALVGGRFIGYIRDVPDMREVEHRLEFSEAKLRRVTESMRDFVAELDSDARYTYVSPSYSKYLGLSEVSLVGQWVLDRVHPDDRQEVVNRIRRAATGVKEVEALFRYLDGFGEWRWIEARGSVLKDASGVATGFVISSRDVTDRQRAMEERQWVEGIMRIFLDSIPDLAFIKDEELRNIYVNKSYLSFIGRPLSDVLGKRDSEFLPASLAARCVSSDLRSMSQRTTIVEEEDYGESVYETVKFPVQLGESRVGLGGVVRDITQRRRMSQELERRIQALTEPVGELGSVGFGDLFDLRSAEQLLVGLYEATGVMSVLADPDGRVLARAGQFPDICKELARAGVRCDGACAVSGDAGVIGPLGGTGFCSGGRLMHATNPVVLDGKVVAHWVVGWVSDANDSDAERMRTALSLGLDDSWYLSVHRKTVAMGVEEFGRVTELVKLLSEQLAQLALRNIHQARHIAQRRKEQEERSQLEEQLRHAQKMEAIGRLSGGIAHEFGNLLTTVVGNLTLAREEVQEGSRLAESLSEIAVAVSRAESLTRQVLSFSRKQVLDYRELAPGTVFSNTLRLLGRLKGDDINLNVEIAPDLGPVLADPGQLEQIVANLVVNAFDAVAGGGDVWVVGSNEVLAVELKSGPWVVPAGRYAVLEVRDSGKGIAPEAMEHIFEPFYTTKCEGQGTGLGLSTVYAAVQQHNGHISVISSPGNGASFKAFFPLLEGSKEGLPSTVEMGALGGSEHVMVVAQDPSLMFALSRILERGGYRVSCYEAWDGAVGACGQGAGPDVVVWDLPTAVGLEELLTVCGGPGLPLVVTGGGLGTGLGEAVRALAGEVVFIRRPYSVAGMAAAIRRALESRQRPS